MGVYTEFVPVDGFCFLLLQIKVKLCWRFPSDVLDIFSVLINIFLIIIFRRDWSEVGYCTLGAGKLFRNKRLCSRFDFPSCCGGRLFGPVFSEIVGKRQARIVSEFVVCFFLKMYTTFLFCFLFVWHRWSPHNLCEV